MDRGPENSAKVRRQKLLSEPFAHKGCTYGQERCGGPATDDGELIERAKQEETGAYDQLVERYQSLAVRTAYLIAGPHAEDVAQEAFVKAYYALKRFKTGSPFKPWLLRIVTNEALNLRKSMNSRGQLALRVARESRPGDAAPSPETVVLKREANDELVAALNGLPDRDRLLIGSRYFLDLSEAEMSEALGIPRGTVKSRLSRAMQRLREELIDV